LDSSSNVVYSFSGAGGGSFSPNTAYFSGPLTFRFGTPIGGSGVPVIDDVTFDVRAIGNQGAVPEPATWAMMLFGFGLVGSTMRRRTATRVAATM
jgi:PEP-CTERM motif